MSKSFDRKDVFTIATAEDAKEYIGKEGYFSDNLYMDIYEWSIGLLGEVNLKIIDFPFGKTNGGCYRLFIPTNKIKKSEEEKKWRAFKNFEEFIVVLGTIGCHVRYRLKTDKNNEFLASINGFNYKAQSITINAVRYTFTELFDKFEFYKNKKWQPFGIEE